MNSITQKELKLYVTPLSFAALAAFTYVFIVKFVRPGIQLDQHLWANPFAVGWLWGAAGIIVPLGFFLYFWTGLYKRIMRMGFGTGVITWLAMLGVPLFAAWRYLIDFSKVWNDEEQQYGLMFGWATIIVLVCSYKALFLAWIGRPAKKWYNRLAGNDDQLSVNDPRTTRLYDEEQEVMDH